MSRYINELSSKDFEEIRKDITMMIGITYKSLLMVAEKYDVDKNELLDFYLYVLTDIEKKTDFSKMSGQKAMLDFLNILKSCLASGKDKKNETDKKKLLQQKSK